MVTVESVLRHVQAQDSLAGLRMGSIFTKALYNRRI
jgi:hypothetical protein